jgi:hypothetical protein
VHQENPVLDSIGLVVRGHNAGKHIPFAGSHARGERPITAQAIATLNFAGAAGRENEGGRDQCVRILVPNQILRPPIKHAQHPVMAGQIGEIPGYGSVTLPEQFCAVYQGDIVQLESTYPFRLNDPEETGFVQVAFGLGRQAAQFLGACGSVTKPRNKGVGACQDGRERTTFRTRCSGLACDWPLTNTRHVPSLASDRRVAERRLPPLRNPLDRLYLLGDCLSRDH